MRPTLRLAHVSDLHLDPDYHGGESNRAMRDHHRAVFATLLERIAARGPHLMLMAGDLFDSNRASDATIAWTLERLGSLPFPVVIIPGNHDCLEEGAIFHRHDFGRAANVRPLLHPEGEGCELAGLRASVWGRGMVAHHPHFEPLAGLTPPRPGRWNLALGHGIYAGSDGNGYRSSPVRAAQIAQSGYDYIALGHHHALLDVSEEPTRALYSGAPVPISPEGQGTWLLVTLEEGRPPQVEIHALDGVPPVSRRKA